MNRLRHPFVMNDFADLENRYGREEPHKQKDQEKEESDGAGVRGPIPFGWDIDPPGGRQEIAMQAGDDDDETLEPHADIDNDRDDPDRHYAQAHLTSPE